MPSVKHCCCCDDTKESLGLPDTITVEFSGATSDCSGMPADSEIGLCGGNTIHAAWRCDSALIDAITSLDFDYVGPTTGCCFLYRTAGTEQPCPDLDAAYVAVGESPFFPSATVDSYLYRKRRDNVTVDPDPGTPEACCYQPSLFDCNEICGWGYSFYNGTVYSPLQLYVRGELRICVDGSTVTIAITLSLVATYDCLTTGPASAGWDSSYMSTDCEVIPAAYTGSPEVVCASVAGAIYIDAGPQDVGGETGTTIWDKIQSATWTAGYEYAMCGVGGGCTGYAQIITEDCQITESCYCGSFPNPEVIDEYNHPMDQDCIYAAGDVTLAFS